MKKIQFNEHPIEALHGLSTTYELTEDDYIALAHFRLWHSPKTKKMIQHITLKHVLKKKNFWATIAFTIICLVIMSTQEWRTFTHFLCFLCLPAFYVKNQVMSVWHAMPYSMYHNWWKDNLGEKSIHIDEESIVMNQGEYEAPLAECKLFADIMDAPHSQTGTGYPILIMQRINTKTGGI